MASAGNFFNVENAALEHNSVDVAADYTVRVGTTANKFMIDRVVKVTDPAANCTITVPDGKVVGQPVLLVCASNDDSKTVGLSVTHHVTSDPETFTLSTVDQWLVLIWTGTKWATFAGDATAT